MKSRVLTVVLFGMRTLLAQGLLLRSDLNRAIEEEDYATAARIRDELAAMEEGASMLEASMEIERWDVAQPLFEIGQRFVHATKVRDWSHCTLNAPTFVCLGLPACYRVTCITASKDNPQAFVCLNQS